MKKKEDEEEEEGKKEFFLFFLCAVSFSGRAKAGGFPKVGSSAGGAPRALPPVCSGRDVLGSETLPPLPEFINCC